ncbi:MAG: hypothetical protein ACODAD_14465 [Planctomycetota bacterium]
MTTRKAEKQWGLVKVLVGDMEIVADALESGICGLLLLGDSMGYIRKAVGDAKRACKASSVAGVMIATMTFYRHLGGQDFHELLAAAQKHRDRGRAGGKMNAISDAEKVRQFHEWDQALRAYSKKSVGFKRLKIPKSTYYAYRKVALEKKR